MLRCVALVSLLLLGLAGPAAAATDMNRAGPSEPLTQSVLTQHFAVHYVTTAGDPNATTTSAAQTIAANAEFALSTFESWGYPAPLDDGDGRVDIDVFLFADNVAAGRAYVRAPAVVQAGPYQYAGRMELRVGYATGKALVAHELFHVVQFGMYANTAAWVLESTARWAEHAGPWHDGWAATEDTGYLSHPEMSFDCTGDACAPALWDGGYGRWLFWSFLSNRYGLGIVHEYFDQLRATNSYLDPLRPLDAVLQAHGSSLALTWNDFAVANAQRSYPALAASSLAVATQKATAGTSYSTTVPHLAAQYVELQPPTSACTTATLHVRVTAPAGAGRAYVVLGATATPATDGAADVSWPTCGAHPLVVLPNDATSSAAAYSVATTIGDTPPPTPTPTTPPGTTKTPSATPGDTVPTLALLGVPAVVKLSSAKPQLALALSSNAPGRVELSLDGAAPFATRDVGLGTNTLRLALPRGLKGRRTLLLTSLSPGGVRGATLRVVLAFR